ncbi:FCD domain-containing protein [Agrobacterium vitis]|uniref:Transcriptional regulator GntR family n=2 Tax=Rhizobium/Agrobacterium group TaxID=227290 RepID=B9K114_ALLAM|nr:MULTISPECIES: FCD domain-containing protein [Rhizobium/Agrobacterium group]ACM38562.1 transcriptional regulator GntR family [Allorhizobium ampelinum S4]MCF1432781.1 FCD domain-containing protein [Allorhizobium ampelinum]MCF1445730.1 FCD domain-containing protein [Allorhizobium ampelinum]MCF1460743.1 FCD domain-containing protein [Allorhizobium ampelinum]MCF1491278.1 FCD domain-containing protein [Allorhizobium ampelinum]
MSLTGRIEAMIAERKLSPGDRLPPERSLAAELDVSRSRLREAIQQLISRGIVVSRRGGGTFVAIEDAARSLERALEPLLPMVQGEAGYWRDVMEIRKSLDTDAAYYAALRATDLDKERMTVAFAAMSAAEGGNPQSQARADAAFHMAIAEASHNVVLRQIVAGLSELLQQSIAQSLMQFYRQPDLGPALERQHGLILDTILAGRPDEARKAAADHLAFVEENLRVIEDNRAREQRASEALQRPEFQGENLS